MIHRLDLLPTAGGVWTLTLAWALHRRSPRGLGRGRPVNGADLLADPPAGLSEADRRVIEAALPEGLSPRGGAPVLVPADDTDAALRALTRARRVQWSGSRNPALIETLPLLSRLVGLEKGGGLELGIQWREPGGEFHRPGRCRIVGSSPPWVEIDGVLRPLEGLDSGAATAALVGGIFVAEGELPGFLGSAVPALEAAGLEVDLEGLEGRRFLVQETAVPRLYLSEQGTWLVATLRFLYGDFEVSADNPESVLRLGPEGAYLHRDMDAEFAATVRLRELGFRIVEPGRFEMEGDDALDFLTCDLPLLAEAWEVFGEDRLRRYRVSSAPVNLRARLGADLRWLDLEVEADAGGEPIPAREVLRALRSGSKYVRLGSGEVGLLPERWLHRIGPALVDAGVRSGQTRLPLYMAPLVGELVEEGVPFEVDGAQSWARLHSLLSGSPEVDPEPLPDALGAPLRPYQEQGYRWMRAMGRLELGCILADDMGLGKTVQALAVLLAARERGEAGPNLVVAPTSVVANWEAEARKFTPVLRVLRHHGADRRVEEITHYDLVVTSYAVLRLDIEELGGLDWNYAILDESQAIKNAATQTARAVRKLKARHRLTLTGTPLENHLGELWSQFQFLNPGLLGSQRRFTKTFARPIARGDAEAREALRRRIRPFILRRLKSEVAQDLPPKAEHVVLCEMGEAQAHLYRSILEASRDRVLGEVKSRGVQGARLSVLEALLRLRQVCCHPQVLPGDLGGGVPSAKFEVFGDFVREVIEEGHRVLVFSQFVKVLEVLRGWFEGEGIRHLYMDGRTRNREEKVREFQEDESYGAFLVSLKTGGVGLNLTGADYVILYDPWWNPAVETQATDRAHRIGQTRKVFSYKLVTRGTVEEKMLLLQERKRELTDDLIRSGESPLAGLTEEDLEELFHV